MIAGTLDQSLAFQSFFRPKPPSQPPKLRPPSQDPNAGAKPKSVGIQRIQLEDELLSSIDTSKRLDNSYEIDYLISQLENSGWSISEPAIAQQVIGKWKLLCTTNADTASPIQKKAVDASQFNIYQDIILKDVTDDNEMNTSTTQRLIVSQIVKFGLGSQLCVDALASTSKYPLPELTERVGTGKILGVNILGVSKVGEDAKEDENNPDARIKFVFDEGRFTIFNFFNVPYPVPFRLPIFRDAVKGWIDITYLSDRMRISRGNKGTTFILVKEKDE